MKRLLLAAALAAACSDSGLQNVEPSLLIDPGNADFGNVAVLDDKSITFQLSNPGSAPLEITSVTLEGDDAFHLPEKLPTGLARGADDTFVVKFIPKEQKPYAAKLIFASLDTTNPRIEVPLTGTGSTAGCALIEPLSLDFGRVGESRSAVKRVKITSCGTADLKIRTIKFKPESSAAYGFVGSTRTPQVVEKREAGKEDRFVELTVKYSPTGEALGTDGTLVIETTDPEHAIVEIPCTASVNRQPLAKPGTDRQVIPGQPVTMDASESSDPDGDVPLTYKWTLSQRPQGSAATLQGADTVNPTFVPDQPGTFALELIVTDSAGLASKVARVVISAVTSDKLLVELVWDHPTADLDLHMRPEGTAFGSAKDCTGDRPHPDFGVEGNPDDDPSHSGDRLSGFGPELITYEDPADGKYLVAVKYLSAQGSSNKVVRATVRVYLYGVIQREVQRIFSEPGEVWTAARITWPSGEVLGDPGATP